MRAAVTRAHGCAGADTSIAPKSCENPLIWGDFNRPFRGVEKWPIPPVFGTFWGWFGIPRPPASAKKFPRSAKIRTGGSEMESASMWWCWDPEAVQATIGAIVEQLTEAVNQLFAELKKLTDAISDALISKAEQSAVIPDRRKRFAPVRCIGRPCRGYHRMTSPHARSTI